MGGGSASGGGFTSGGGGTAAGGGGSSAVGGGSAASGGGTTANGGGTASTGGGNAQLSCSASTPCPGSASCNLGTGLCECPPGAFVGTSGCVDINECLTNNGGCDANATCTNTPGSRTCACKSGFTGNGATCTDVNECLTNNGGCDTNATCTNSPGTRTCACNSGYSGSGTTCADINECLTANGGCDTHASCTNTSGSRTCACMSPYQGTGLTCARPTWRLVNTTGPMIEACAMGYDANRKRVVAYGGTDGNQTVVSGTWEWDGTSWTNKNATTPGPLVHARMAYDAVRQKLVMFGGASSGGSFTNAMYEWSGTAWSTVAQGTTRPSARASHGLAYDSTRRVLVLYGGDFGLQDTWEFANGTWTQKYPSPTAGSREDFGMAFDASRGKVVVFGGYDRGGAQSYPTSTWDWNGTSWSQAVIASPPPNRMYGSMAYHASQRQVFLVGGDTETLSFDGTQWTVQATTGPSQGYLGLAYDSDHDQLVALQLKTDFQTQVTTSETWVFGL